MTISGSPSGDGDGERTSSGRATTMPLLRAQRRGSGRRWPSQPEVYGQISRGDPEAQPNDPGADLCRPYGRARGEASFLVPRPSSVEYRYRLDLDQALRERQALDDHQRARRAGRPEVRVARAGDQRPVGEIRDVLRDLDDVVQRPAEVLHDRLDVAVALLGLR